MAVVEIVLYSPSDLIFQTEVIFIAARAISRKYRNGLVAKTPRSNAPTILHNSYYVHKLYTNIGHYQSLKLHMIINPFLAHSPFPNPKLPDVYTILVRACIFYRRGLKSKWKISILISIYFTRRCVLFFSDLNLKQYFITYLYRFNNFYGFVILFHSTDWIIKWIYNFFF